MRTSQGVFGLVSPATIRAWFGLVIFHLLSEVVMNFFIRAIFLLLCLLVIGIAIYNLPTALVEGLKNPSSFFSF
jgi:hypothetical protein